MTAFRALIEVELDADTLEAAETLASAGPGTVVSVMQVAGPERACFGGNPHRWWLSEAGYERVWAVDAEDLETAEAGGVLRATSSGTAEDFSEEGDGRLELVCSMCPARRPVPDAEVSFE